MPARAAATCAVLALVFGAAAGCGGAGGGGGGGGLTAEERAALDFASGKYLSEVDRSRRNAVGTAYGACQQAASDYPIVHRDLFARSFAKRVKFANGKGKHRADLRSVCLVAVAFASS